MAMNPSQPPSQPQNDVQPQPQHQPQQNGALQPPNPDLLYSDPAEWQRQNDAYQRAQVQELLQQTSQPFLQSQSQMARNASRNDPDRADIWGRYALEIDKEMRSVPLQQKANVEAWNMAADLVAGRHRKELMQDAIERYQPPPDTGTESADGLPPSGAPRSAALDPITEMFRENHPAIQKHKDQGFTAEKLKAMLPTMGHTIESYAALLKKHGSISHTEHRDGRTVQNV